MAFIIIACIVIFAVGFIIGIANGVFGGLLVGIVSAVFMMGILIYDNSRNHPYTVYEVTFDDNVKINNILDKYEIIDHKGEIYTIKEINP